MKTLSALLRSRWGHTIRRGLRVFALSAVVAVFIELLSPIAWRYFAASSRQYSLVFPYVVAWVLCVVVFYVAIDALRIRKGQWRSMWRYPPLWSAVPLGWVLAVLSEQWPLGLRPRPVAADWQYAEQTAFFLLALGLAIALRRLLRREPSSRSKPAAANDGQGLSWPTVSTWISSGEQPITQSDQDLFQHQPIARRIAHTVGTEGRHVALLGRFGAGKTSIVKMACDELRPLTPTVIVATADVWAVPNPEDVPRLVLRRIVAALDDHIDTIELRTLPLTYQRLVAAEPTGRLSRILGLDAATDSVEAIGRLSPLLEVLDARLVLIVQDVERTGKGFETRHLDRFLWALRDVERASFILAVDPENVQSDFPKLCDSIELVPELDIRQVAMILGVAYGQWRTQFQDIDPRRDSSRDGKLGLEQTSHEAISIYLLMVGIDGPLGAMASLLNTPRSLKHVLRRVNNTWETLHGEVDLDDLIIMSILRHSAEPAYKFLLRNIAVLRQEPDDLRPRAKAVIEKWDQECKTMSKPDDVRALVELLGIKQLRKDAFFRSDRSPQGVQESRPTDYFRRILADEMGDTELRDQTVLGDIERWQTDRDETLLTKLLEATGENARYALVWEHFSFRHSQEELMTLTDKVVSGVLERDGASADGAHPALICVWSACKGQLPRGRVTDWVQDLILSAVPKSLNLANDLYDYWAGKDGVVTNAQRAVVRKATVAAVRDVVRTGADLIRVLTRDHPYSIVRLVVPNDAAAEPTPYGAWRDYLPAILTEGARLDPETVIPELANLVGREQGKHRRRYKIGREETEALLGDRLDEALALLAEYGGQNAYAVRVKQDAALWLKERRAEGGGT